MRTTFAGYYDWDKEEYVNLWKSAVFALDANTLLDAYRYKESTYKEYMETLGGLAGKLFLPYQAALEFHRNREACIRDQRKAYGVLQKTIKKMVKLFEESQNKMRSHKYIDHQLLSNELTKGLEPLEKIINDAQKAHPGPEEDEAVFKELTEFFDGKVLTKISDRELEDIYTQGATRYKRKVPPGYMDVKDKSEPDCYGDLVIWEELIQLSKVQNAPVIFVTGDTKEDWFARSGGKTSGPCPELIHEFRERTGHLFYAYPPTLFVKHARPHLEMQDANEDTLEDIKSVREDRERNELGLTGLLGATTASALTSMGAGLLGAASVGALSVAGASALSAGIKTRSILGSASLSHEARILRKNLVDLANDLDVLEDYMQEIAQDESIAEDAREAMIDELLPEHVDLYERIQTIRDRLEEIDEE